MSTREHVARVLKDLLERRGLTASGVSVAAGYSHSHLHDVMTGRVRSVKIDTLVDVARVLHVSPAMFFPRGDLTRIIGSVLTEDVIRLIDPSEYGPRFTRGVDQVGGESFAALAVETDALAPFAFRGAMIYYEPTREPPASGDDGRPVVATLEDGMMVVKILRFENGTEPWLSPIAPNASAIRKRPILSAARVRLVLPLELSAAFDDDGEPLSQPSPALHDSPEDSRTAS